MKNYLACAMTTLLTTVAVSMAAPDKDALMAKENAAWQAFRDKKADDFKKVVHADMRAVYSDGVFNVQEELAAMQKWDMKSFAISNYNVVAAGADTAISTYTVTLTGTFGGKDASGTYNAGSVWKMENGAWMAIFHTNIKAEKP